jgi:hypothetical protein
LIRERWRHFTEEEWPNAPQAALDGKSPREFTDARQRAVRLTAAAYAFDSFVEGVNGQLDLEALLKGLGLRPLSPLVPDDQLQIGPLSAMQLHRLPVDALSDAQLLNVYRRTSLIGHRRFAKAVLTEIAARPSCADEVELTQVYSELSALAREEGRLAEAIDWVQRAKESCSAQAESFDEMVSWLLYELLLRAEQPDDPGLPAVYRTLAESYAPKVRQVQMILESFRRTHGDRLPWLKSQELAVGAPDAPGSPGGIWTPASEPSAAPGKLWLPGRE